MKKSYFAFILPVWLLLGISFLGLADGGAIGPNAEVVLAYQEGEDIIIMECRKYAPLPDHEDEDVDFWRWRSECRHGWQTERGRFKSRIPEGVFKKSLLLALRVPGDYGPELQEKIIAYNEDKVQEQRTPNLLEEKERLTAQIKLLEELIENFTTRFNQEAIDFNDVDELWALKSRLEEIEWELSVRDSEISLDNTIIFQDIDRNGG